MHVRVPALDPTELLNGDARQRTGDAAAHDVQDATRDARELQQRRSQVLNRDLAAVQLDNVCRLNKRDRGLLSHAAEKLALSARGCHRVLRVARTIADLDGRAQIRWNDLTEALSYRSLVDTAAEFG